MKNGMVKVLTVILAVFLVVFTGYHAYRHFFKSYSTVDVYRYTVYHTAVAKGVFIRDEIDLGQSTGEHLRYAVKDGEKVKVGTPLAYRYNSATEAARALEYQNNQNELAALKKVQSLLSSNNVPKVTELTAATDVSVTALAESIALGNYDSLETKELALQYQLNMGAALTGITLPMEQRITELEAAAHQNYSSVLYSSAEGYFSYYVDGCEDSLAPDKVGSITADELSRLTARDYPVMEGTLGKVIRDYRWYFVTLLSARDAKDFPIGSTVTLSFAGSDAKGVEAYVESQQPEADGKSVVVTFSGTEMNTETASRRCTSVRISSPAYTGIRFDAEHLHIVDGEKGIFVDGGYTVAFKKVDIIYEGDGYYLSRLNYTGEECINIFDRIIVSDAELYDGMPLNEI